MSAKTAFLVGNDFEPSPTEPIMPALFREYERILVESLVSSFGLDFLIRDQYGGDVDTIYNVRQITDDGSGPMYYKNALNKDAYEQRGKYTYSSYHSDKSNYSKMTSEPREESRKTGKPLPMEDEYTGGTVYVLGKSAPPEKRASVDHVLSTKTIQEDRGRILAGLKGEDLADAPENLRRTNVSLNSSMGATKDEQGNPVEIPEYIALHPELPEETKKKMMQAYNEAKSSYERKLARAYYTSPRFAQDMARAAGNVSVRMGARQALGFVFAEMWFAVKEEFQQADDGETFDLAVFLERVGNGLKHGWERAQKKYAELFSRFLSGAVAGAISSVTTTLCNIFFTTAKSTVRIIRQSYASLVEAGKILFINPECYTFGERMRAVAKILAAGASVVTGTVVSEAIGKTPIAAIPVLGDTVQAFCGAFVGGIMSCTLLYLFDHSETINKLVRSLDKIHTIETEVSYFRQQADYFERYAAELMQIDLDKFREEIALFHGISNRLENARTGDELNAALKNACREIGAAIPWQGYNSFDDFMHDKSARLVFE